MQSKKVLKQLDESGITHKETDGSFTNVPCPHCVESGRREDTDLVCNFDFTAETGTCVHGCETTLDELVEILGHEVDKAPNSSSTKRGGKQGGAKTKHATGRLEIETVSHVLKSGALVEMVHDPDEETTAFLTNQSGDIERVERIQLENGKVLVPLPPDHNALTRSFVHFASSAEKYDSEQKLLKDIQSFICRYVELPRAFLPVVATYIMMTWLYDEFPTLPYLRVIAMYGTGKTRFLTTVGSLCYKSMVVGGSFTASTAFRSADRFRGTFVIDEADFKNSEMWSEIIKILNNGHTEKMPVLRSKKTKSGDFEPEAFDVFGPKVLASRERFSDEALESRCLTQPLLPRSNVRTSVHLPKEFANEALELRNKLMMFRFKCRGKIVSDEDTVKQINFPRLKQSALALTSVASFADTDVLDKVVKFLCSYEKDLQEQQKYDTKVDVLICIVRLLARRGGETGKYPIPTGKLYIKEIAEEFNEENHEEYSPYEAKEYWKENSEIEIFSYPHIRVSPKKVGGHVRKLGIRPERDSEGFYVSVVKELKVIERLCVRYGIEDYFEEYKRLFQNEQLDFDRQDPEEINPEDIEF